MYCVFKERASGCVHYGMNEYNKLMRTLEPVSDIALGLTHPRRTKLQHGTFLRFGHPRLVLS